MHHLTRLALKLAEQGLVPDMAVRYGIRLLLMQRLREIRSRDAQAAARQELRFIGDMRRAPMALVPEKANDQHYEVPVEFFRQVLGPHLKYSSAFWPTGATTLAQAEAAGLRESCLHAGLMNGQTILELGCGWGSLTLWMAERYPDSRIVAVSDSQLQHAYIEGRARARGLERQVRVVTLKTSEHTTLLRFGLGGTTSAPSFRRSRPLDISRNSSGCGTSISPTVKEASSSAQSAPCICSSLNQAAGPRTSQERDQ